MIFRAKSKALVFDDKPAFEKLLTEMLLRLDWDCEVVTEPEAARARLEASHFDLLITDYHMPQGNGFHFVCCLRRDRITVPAIVMSGDTQVLRLAPKDLLTIPAVLLKPFTVSELREALTKVSSFSGESSFPL